jgi:hypothetical protein
MTMEEIRQKYLDALHQLGKEEWDVFYYLKTNQIKGFIQSPNWCPIARYFDRIGSSVSVGNEMEKDGIIHRGVGVFDPYYEYWFGIEEYPELIGVYKFIKSFDEGKYEELKEQ